MAAAVTYPWAPCVCSIDKVFPKPCFHEHVEPGGCSKGPACRFVSSSPTRCRGLEVGGCLFKRGSSAWNVWRACPPSCHCLAGNVFTLPLPPPCRAPQCHAPQRGQGSLKQLVLERLERHNPGRRPAFGWPTL